MGYADNGKRLATRITGEWSNEFVEGRDFVVLTGAELAEFKSLLEDGTLGVLSFSSRLLLLFESGVFRALTKTEKPVGQRLRDFLSNDVLPQIGRDGHYVPGRTLVEAEASAAQSPLASTREERRRAELALKVAKEERLKAQQLCEAAKEERLRDKLSLEKDKLSLEKDRLSLEVTQEANRVHESQLRRMESLRETFEAKNYLSTDELVTYEISIVEEATGKDLARYKLSSAEERFWKTATQLAYELGVSTKLIGTIARKVGVWGNIPGIAKLVNTTATHSDMPVQICLYSPEAVRRIKAALLEEDKAKACNSANKKAPEVGRTQLSLFGPNKG